MERVLKFLRKLCKTAPEPGDLVLDMFVTMCFTVNV